MATDTTRPIKRSFPKETGQSLHCTLGTYAWTAYMYVHTHIRTCRHECSLTANGCQCSLHVRSLSSSLSLPLLKRCIHLHFNSQPPSPDMYSLHPSLLTLSRTIHIPSPTHSLPSSFHTPLLDWSSTDT